MQSLLDTNVLIALLWPAHSFHRVAQDWFHKNASDGWATCPITQSGFVRVVSQASFSPNALTVPDALAALEKNLSHPNHEFWPDELSVPECVALLQKPLQGHRQLTDAYLLGMTIYRKANFISLDQRIASLLPENKRESGIIVNLSAKLH
jgi:uncharacterized protein